MVLVTKKGKEEKVDAKVLRAFFNGSVDDRVLPGAIIELPAPLFRELESARKVRRAGKGDKNEPKEPQYGQAAKSEKPAGAEKGGE